MSLETMGSVGWAHEGLHYVHLAQASALTLHNSWFDSTRGASSACFRPPKAGRHHGRSRRSSGSRALPPVSLRDRDRSRPGTATTASGGRPHTATSSALTVTTGSGRGSSAWFGSIGSRPSTRGSLGAGGRDDRRRRRRQRDAQQRRVAPAYPARPDPWAPHRARRRYEQAVEAERSAAAWSEPELQEWLAKKQAQKQLRVGTWAAETVRMDGQPRDRCPVPHAPLARWERDVITTLAEQELGYGIDSEASKGAARAAAELANLATTCDAAADAWDEANLVWLSQHDSSGAYARAAAVHSAISPRVNDDDTDEAGEAMEAVQCDDVDNQVAAVLSDLIDAVVAIASNEAEKEPASEMTEEQPQEASEDQS